MKLKVLVDNNCFIDKYYLGEPALSFYIEDEDKKILFDTGYSDILIKNAELMNINLKNIDYVVLSHGHNDHTGGLKYLNDSLSKSTIICHPSLFSSRNNNGLEIGSPLIESDLKTKNIIKTTIPYKITNNIYFLGEINRDKSFKTKSIGFLANGKPDNVIDDSAIVYKSKNGLFIITGCSHSGITNIVETAKKYFNDDRIVGIIGGFHLLEDDEQLLDTIDYFKKNNINELWPCHCVSLYAKAKMIKEFNVHEVGVGLEINI